MIWVCGIKEFIKDIWVRNAAAELTQEIKLLKNIFILCFVVLVLFSEDFRSCELMPNN